MQYKQAVRILTEIVKTPNVPVKVALAAIRLFLRRDGFPRLGPYRKRSPQQVLWRVASDSLRSPDERWVALLRLIRQTPRSASA